MIANFLGEDKTFGVSSIEGLRPGSKIVSARELGAANKSEREKISRTSPASRPVPAGCGWLALALTGAAALVALLAVPFGAGSLLGRLAALLRAAGTVAGRQLTEVDPGEELQALRGQAEGLGRLTGPLVVQDGIEDSHLPWEETHGAVAGADDGSGARGEDELGLARQIDDLGDERVHLLLALGVLHVGGEHGLLGGGMLLRRGLVRPHRISQLLELHEAAGRSHQLEELEPGGLGQDGPLERDQTAVAAIVTRGGDQVVDDVQRGVLEDLGAELPQPVLSLTVTGEDLLLPEERREILEQDRGGELGSGGLGGTHG